MGNTPWGMIAVAAHSVRSSIESKHRAKKLKIQAGKLPKYQINDEAFQNQNIARGEAFGADRDVQMAQQDIDSGVAAGAQQARDITTSSSTLLQALTNIQTGGFSAKRGLAEYEAGTLRRQKINTLYGINRDMIDEKDKAWNQNEYAPWELEYRRLQEYDMNRTAQASAESGALGGAGGMSFGNTGGTGGNGGIKIRRRANDNSPVYNDPAEYPRDIS